MSKWTPAADEKNQGTLEFEIARAQVEEGLDKASNVTRTKLVFLDSVRVR